MRLPIHFNTIMILVLSCCFGLASFSAQGNEKLKIIAGPYLHYPTDTTMTVGWETNIPATTEGGCGAAAAALEWTEGEGGVTFHFIVFTDLEPAENYFYQIRSKAEGAQVVESEIYSFQTAVVGEAPFSFVVLSDTQANPRNVVKLANLAWEQRPHFTLLTGDLVSKGPDKGQWNNHFFRNMKSLLCRVPLVPSLGNHEEDTHYYYDYFALPEPKYYYQLRYGNLELFILDTQRPVAPNSEQYTWLEGALKASTAPWKIVALHRPAYSSDENDYGDTTEVRPNWGDHRIRELTTLYERYGVDIAWCGHIHSYERSYPLIQDKPVQKGGVVYMVTGGGGGGLETAGPWRSPFTAKVYRGHHYCLVNVFGPTMRIEAYTPEGQLFDFLELRK
ncbi:MAG: metallophosphoesterase [Candidatus Hydrogenedentales bacterium]|jgi:hypothetical protein